MQNGHITDRGIKRYGNKSKVNCGCSPRMISKPYPPVEKSLLFCQQRLALFVPWAGRGALFGRSHPGMLLEKVPFKTRVQHHLGSMNPGRSRQEEIGKAVKFHISVSFLSRDLLLCSLRCNSLLIRFSLISIVRRMSNKNTIFQYLTKGKNENKQRQRSRKQGLLKVQCLLVLVLLID